MNIALWLDRSAAVMGARPALMHGTAVVADYATLGRRASGLAAALAARGVAPGDRVGVFAKNLPDYLTCLFGIWRAGAAAVPVNAKLHPKEAALAWLFYTSGTTGRPKGVQITHGMLAATSLCYIVDVDPVAEADAALYAAPMSHGAGLYALIHVRMGAAHLVIPPAAVRRGRGARPLRGARQPPRCSPPPPWSAACRRRRRAARRGAGIRTIVYGGGPMYLADITEAVEVMGPRFVQIYGQGESPMTITALPRDLVADRSHPDWRARLASVGRAFSECRGAHRRRRGPPLPPGAVGEIWCAADRSCPATGRTRRPRRDAAGRLALDRRWGRWTRTASHAARPLQGRDHLGRHQHLSARGGGGAAHPPRRAEVSVVGRAHPEWGEEVVAFVVPPRARPDPPRSTALPRPHRAVQAAQGLPLRGGACRRTTTARCSRPSCAERLEEDKP
jgi:long-chain acyl-CoA synthetase